MKINNQQSFIKGYIAELNESKIYKIHPELYGDTSRKDPRNEDA